MTSGDTGSSERAEVLRAIGSEWSWKRFDREIRGRDRRLLECIDNYSSPILIAGCQRSGTTMLGKVLSRATEIHQHEFSQFAELSAALVLCGEVDPGRSDKRTVFQTTYVDECYAEYRDVTSPTQILWMIRNPHSVITSMVHNWPRFALKSTYDRIGRGHEDREVGRLHHVLGGRLLGRMGMAIAVYRAKLAQLFELRECMPTQVMQVVEYDTLTRDPVPSMRAICGFLELETSPAELVASIHGRSRAKASRLSGSERERISLACGEEYARAVRLSMIEGSAATPDASGPVR